MLWIAFLKVVNIQNLNSITNIFQGIHNLFIRMDLLSNIYINLKKQPDEVSLTKKLSRKIRHGTANLLKQNLIYNRTQESLVVYMTYQKLVSFLKHIVPKFLGRGLLSLKQQVKIACHLTKTKITMHSGLGTALRIYSLLPENFSSVLYFIMDFI